MLEAGLAGVEMTGADMMELWQVAMDHHAAMLASSKHPRMCKNDFVRK